MRIALLTDGIYPFVLGGMQKHSYYLAKYLAQRQVKVDLYHCVAFGKELPKNILGFKEEELMFINQYSINFPKSSFYPGHYLVESYNYSKQLYQIFIKQPQPDIIYSQGFSGWYFMNQFKKLSNIPVIVNFHGLEMFQKAPSFKVWLEHLLLRPAVKFNLSKANSVISLGGKLSDVLLEFNDSILEMPIGIEENWIFQKEHENQLIKFVFVGRYERRKGVEELNNAIKSIQDNYNFEFHFIGPIAEIHQIVCENVFYHGSIRDQEEMKTLLRQMDVMVVPSWSEGMPTVILEGMASGCAIVASDVGAVNVQVGEDNGWLIEPGNVQQLSDLLKSIIGLERKLLKEKQNRSLEKVKAFTWENIIDRHIHIFEEIIKNKKNSN